MTLMQEEGKPHGLAGPCPAALGMIGVPARRWLTKADLYAQLEEARAFMDTCPLETVNQAACAEHAGLSLHHFLRLFHEVHGITPHQYLARRRIGVAKQLLEETQRSVSEIAVEVGFGGASAFGRMFKQEVGSSPSTYRKTIFARSVEHATSDSH
jgi:transcriptional regulator GlxA family with amidase domain